MNAFIKEILKLNKFYSEKVNDRLELFSSPENWLAMNGIFL